MGYHSTSYYNHKCKKGNTKKTGYAWWYNEKLENPDNPSHYEGFIPLSVLRESFGWSAAESVELTAKFQIDGKEYLVPVNRFKALGRTDWIVNGIPDTEELGADKILDIPNIDYGVHDPKEVFITNVAELFSGADNIGCESFGELKWGRRLFASFSIPENLMNSKSGLEFRPTLTVVTSFDRTLATKYVRTYGIPVCDNTMNYELARAGEKDGHFILRHSKNSAGKLKGAKEMLGLLDQQADVMDKWLDELVNVEVKEADFHKWMNRMVPIPDPKTTITKVKSVQGEDVEIEKVSYHAQTQAQNKHLRLMDMWEKDHRVAPWRNTRLGIFMLWNTYIQHEVPVKATRALGGGKDATDEQRAKARVTARIESNFEKMINDVFTKDDVKALNAIAEIQSENVMVPVSRKTRAKAEASA